MAIFVGFGVLQARAFFKEAEEPVITKTEDLSYRIYPMTAVGMLRMQAVVLHPTREDFNPRGTSVGGGVADTTKRCSEWGDCEAYRGIITSFDWPSETAMAICKAESGGTADATNWNDSHGSCIGSHGLFQIACFWAPNFGYNVEDLDTPEINVKVAYLIWKENGFYPWTTYKKIIGQ